MESISPIHGKVKCVHSYSFYKRVASIEMVVKSRQMSHQNPYCSVPTLDLYCPKHFYTFRFHDDQHNDRSLYALLYIFIWNFSSKHSLTVAQFYCKPSVCSCTYWAAIKIYKAMRLFEKVSFVWSLVLLPFHYYWNYLNSSSSSTFFHFIYFIHPFFIWYISLWQCGEQVGKQTHRHIHMITTNIKHREIHNSHTHVRLTGECEEKRRHHQAHCDGRFSVYSARASYCVDLLCLRSNGIVFVSFALYVSWHIRLRPSPVQYTNVLIELLTHT